MLESLQSNHIRRIVFAVEHLQVGSINFPDRMILPVWITSRLAQYLPCNSSGYLGRLTQVTSSLFRHSASPLTRVLLRTSKDVRGPLRAVNPARAVAPSTTYCIYINLIHDFDILLHHSSVLPITTWTWTAGRRPGERPTALHRRAEGPTGCGTITDFCS